MSTRGRLLFRLTITLLIGAGVVLSASAARAHAVWDAAPAYQNNCSPNVASDPATLEVTNATADSINLYWVDFDCQEILYQTIPAGGLVMQPAFVGHVWLVRDSQTGQQLQTFTSTGGTQSVFVGAAQSAPAPASSAPPQPAQQPVNCTPNVASDPITLSIENATGGDVNLFWVDFNCQEVFYQTLAAGTVGQQASFVGHVWVVRAADSNALLSEITSIVGQPTVTVTEPSSASQVAEPPVIAPTVTPIFDPPPVQPAPEMVCMDGDTQTVYFGYSVPDGAPPVRFNATVQASTGAAMTVLNTTQTDDAYNPGVGTITLSCAGNGAAVLVIGLYTEGSAPPDCAVYPTPTCESVTLTTEPASQPYPTPNLLDLPEIGVDNVCSVGQPHTVTFTYAPNPQFNNTVGTLPVVRIGQSVLQIGSADTRDNGDGTFTASVNLNCLSEGAALLTFYAFGEGDWVFGSEDFSRAVRVDVPMLVNP